MKISKTNNAAFSLKIIFSLHRMAYGHLKASPTVWHRYPGELNQLIMTIASDFCCCCVSVFSTAPLSYIDVIKY